MNMIWNEKLTLRDNKNNNKEYRILWIAIRYLLTIFRKSKINSLKIVNNQNFYNKTINKTIIVPNN